MDVHMYTLHYKSHKTQYGLRAAHIQHTPSLIMSEAKVGIMEIPALAGF
jgi:hypothetical protein